MPRARAASFSEPRRRYFTLRKIDRRQCFYNDEYIGILLSRFFSFCLFLECTSRSCQTYNFLPELTYFVFVDCRTAPDGHGAAGGRALQGGQKAPRQTQQDQHSPPR